MKFLISGFSKKSLSKRCAGCREAERESVSFIVLLELEDDDGEGNLRFFHDFSCKHFILP